MGDNYLPLALGDWLWVMIKKAIFGTSLWSLVLPIAGCAMLVAIWERPLGWMLLAFVVLILVAAVFAAVHHAEVIALRVGEPFGTLVLALAVTVIEATLIVTLMLAGGEATSALARDTVYATVMIICNGVVGLCLLLGALRYRVLEFRVEGTNPVLSVLATLATLRDRFAGPDAPDLRDDLVARTSAGVAGRSAPRAIRGVSVPGRHSMRNKDMFTRTLVMVVVSLFALVACERAGDQKPAPSPAALPEQAARPAPAKANASFVNRVWTVAESKQVAPGEVRVFLSDGTLVMTSPHAAPAFGKWRYGDGRLTIIEEGLEYPVDILALDENAFRIRMLSPGEPVEILFAPAEEVLPESVGATRQVNVAQEPAQPPVPLWGTAWRLENLAGAGVLDRVQATLEFPSEGRASGSGSCNRFNGVVTVEGSTIQFGGLATTRKACLDAVMRQEDAYFAALRDALRFEIDGQTLRIHTADRPEPLRFVATEATAQRPAESIQRAAVSATPALMGIWTVVAHHNPGVSALSNDAARARYGETVRLTAGAAISAGNRCGEPKYAARQVPATSYLATEFKLSPGSLKPLAGRNQVQLMEVSCGGAAWTALGAKLLEINAERALTPWDGAFFELARDRDFRAIGQEPGWQLEIRKGAEMRLTYDYGKSMAVTPAPKVLVDSSSGRRTYHAVSEANDLNVVIVPVPCNDSMSGKPFPSTVSVTLNGRTFRGCGEELATPFEG